MQGAPGSRPRGRMVSLGRVTAPKPVNLPSQKRENNGNDPNIPLVPKTVTSSVWGSQASQGEAPPSAQGPPQQGPPPAQPAQGQPAGSAWGGAVGSDRRQASALLAQDEFPTLGAPVAETLPNGAPYGHGPQGYANGVPPSHPPMDRAAWDGPSHGPPYGKTGSPANFHYGSWGAPTGERWADSAPPRGPPPAPAHGGAPAQYGAMDARMDMQGPPYMPAHGGGYMPFNQPPPPPPRTRPPSAPSDHSGPRYMGAPPEHPGRPQEQHTGGPAAHGHGHGPGQYEGHGQIGAASMGGTGYMPPHLRNRDRAEGGMPRPGSEWSIAAQASESLPDEVPPQATPPKILRRDVPAAQHSAPRPGAPPNPQQQHGQHHRGEGHHRSSHADLAPMHPPPPQQQQQQPFAHQHPHQPRSQAPQGPGQGQAASQPPRVNVPHQQPPPPQQQQQQQPAVQRLQFGQLGSPPGYSRDEGRQPPLPADLHLPNGHLSTPPSGPVAKLQNQHSTGGQGFSPKVAQQLGLGRQESAQDGPGRANGQAAQANGPIMTFGQPAPKVQHQPVAASSRMASAQEAAVPGRTAGGQSAALSELEAQKMYMRQKVQQRQQEVKMQQQQQGQRSGSEASRRSMPQSAAQQAHGDHAEHALPGPTGPGRGHPGQGAGRGGRGHNAGRGQDAGRGRGQRDAQRPRSSEAQPLEKALPASSSMPPSEQLIMEAKMRSMSLEAHKAPPHSGPPHQRHQPHPHQQQHHQQQHSHQQARGETEAALAGPEGGHRRGSASRDGQPKAVPIVTGPRDSGGRREAPGASQQRRPAVPIALPQPDARRGQAEGRQPPLEGPLPSERKQRERGARREKRMRDRPPASADAAPSDAAQDAGESRQSEQAAAAAAGGSGLPGANRRGGRGERQRPPRGERPGGSANQEAAPQAVDAPPGLGAKQQEPARPVADDHSTEQDDADGPTGEHRERRERPPRSARRDRGQRERLPRPIAAAVNDSDAATDGKGSEPADGEIGQSSAREPRRRAGERAAKKPRAGGDAAAGQQIQAPPGLGPGAQNGLPERAPGQGSRKERAERVLYHPPVKEATESTQEAHAEGSSEQPPLQMTDGKPPGLGRSSRARYGRDRRDRRRPLDGAPEKANGERATDVPPQDDGEQPQGAAQGESQAEEGARPRQHRGQGSRGPGRGGGGRGRGREATTAPGEGGQEGNANAEGKEEAGDGEGLPQRSSRSGRGRGPRGDARGRGAKGTASADAGEAGGSDRDASKVRTLEVARGNIDAKGKRAWMVKDGAGGSQAAAENSSKPSAEGAPPAPSSSA